MPPSCGARCRVPRRFVVVSVPCYCSARPGRLPERPKGADCKSAGIAYRGSNPLPATGRQSSRETPARCAGVSCVVGRDCLTARMDDASRHDAAPDDAWLDAECRRLLDFGRRVVHPRGGAAWLDDDGAPDLGRPVHTWITSRTVHVYGLGALLGVDGRRLDRRGGPRRPARRAPRPRARRLVRRGRSGRRARRRQVLLRPRVRDARRLDRRRRGPAGRRRPARRGDAGLRGTLLGRRPRPRRRRVGPGLDHARALPRPQLHDALARGDARGRRRHRRRRLAPAGRPGWPAWCSSSRRRTTAGCPSTSARTGRSTSSSTATGPTTRSSPTARPSGTAWSGRGCCSTSRPPWATAAPAGLLDTSRLLFDRAVADGWHADGAPGFVYTTDWEGRPVVRQRMHWVVAEGIAAAAALHRRTGEEGTPGATPSGGPTPATTCSTASGGRGTTSSTPPTGRRPACGPASPTSTTRCRRPSSRDCPSRPSLARAVAMSGGLRAPA